MFEMNENKNFKFTVNGATSDERWEEGMSDIYKNVFYISTHILYYLYKFYMKFRRPISVQILTVYLLLNAFELINHSVVHNKFVALLWIHLG